MLHKIDSNVMIIYFDLNSLYNKKLDICYLFVWNSSWFLIKLKLLRVGRTARGEGGKGHALMILRESEIGFLR